MVCLHLENIKENPFTLFMNINFAKLIQNMLFFSFTIKVDEAKYEGFSDKAAQILSKSNIEC